MRRREFIAGLGGVVAWPLVARAQLPGGVRRVGALLGWANADPGRTYLAAFVEKLEQLGWGDGRNVRIEPRWTDADIERARVFAKELVALQPDVILAATTPVTAALLRETREIPIVFAGISDPVGSKFVASLSRPGGNVTGFINEEAAMGGKWLELLKSIAPATKRAAIMFNPITAPGGGNYYTESFSAAARSLAVEPVTLRVHSVADIETAIASLAKQQAGLVLSTDSFLSTHLRTIIALTERHNVPAIFDQDSFAADGGLIAYGANYPDVFRRAAGYVDRILRGARPSDLPVELPIKFDLAINLKTAKALGLTVPDSLLVSATKLIE